MDSYDFNTKFATSFVDNFGTRIDFNPLHKYQTGSMLTTRKGQGGFGGEYTFREENGINYLGWMGDEWIFRPTEVGFDLLSGQTISYSFTRINE